MEHDELAAAVSQRMALRRPPLRRFTWRTGAPAVILGVAIGVGLTLWLDVTSALPYALTTL